MELTDNQILFLREKLMVHAEGLQKWIDHQIPRRFRTIIFAEDILQEVWLAAFRAFSNRQLQIHDWQSCEVERWLKTVAKRKLIDFLRKHNREVLCKTSPDVKMSRGSQSYINLFDAIRGNGKSPSSIEATTEATFAVQTALVCLPEDQRRVIQMYYLAGRSRKSIAATLGVTETALHGTLYRAKNKLQHYMGDPGKFFSDAEPSVVKSGNNV